MQWKLRCARHSYKDAGATGYPPSALPQATLSALITNTLIILTSIHSQDFRDEAGDRLQGRSTLPIAMPNGSRAFMPVLLFLWPIVLQPLYNLSSHLTITLLAISLLVGGRFFYLRNARDDEMSYLFYNVSFHNGFCNHRSNPDVRRYGSAPFKSACWSECDN